MFKKAPIYPGIQASNELSGQMPSTENPTAHYMT